MHKFLLSLSAIFTLCFCGVPAARADVYTYTFSGGANGSFSLDSSLPPAVVNADYFKEAIADATGDFSPFSFAYFVRIGSTFDGDLQFPGGFTIAGLQLYAGTEANPTFLTGAFDLTNFAGGTPTTLNIVNSSVAATPEPSSLILLGTGVLGALGAARRRFTA